MDRLIVVVGLVAAALAVSACGSFGFGDGPQGGDSVVRSNVLRAEYAGSGACSRCHASIAAAFARSPMQRMTRDADMVAPRGPFDGSELHLGGDVAVMRSVGDRRYLHLDSAREGERLYRVTEIIGGRYREDYVGVWVAGAGATDRVIADTRRVLPVSWVIGDQEWRYKGYSVQVAERSGMVAGPVWNRTCIFCHNTGPYLSTAFDDLAESRLRYQGSVPSNLLPRDRRLRFEVQDEYALARAVAEEVEYLGERPPDPWRDPLEEVLSRAAYATRDRFRAEHLVELGIGCEACHGGSREHVESPSVSPSYLPRSPMFSVRAERGELGRAGEINHACARCHSVLFSRYLYTWEGGTRRRNPGGSTINSGEARNYLLGGCARAMSCTACHDPHAEDDAGRLAWLATPEGNVTCTGCHSSLATEAALRGHAHHRPDGLGASCVGCHMPRKNAGLGYALTRYHRIGSPTDAVRVEKDRPLECALCHLDRSVESLVSTMERWWDRSYDRQALRSLYGADLSVPVLEATLTRGLPHEQTVAIERLGHTGEEQYVSPIVEQLSHEYPLVRYFARASLERLTGRRAPMDMSLPGETLREAGRAWVASPGEPGEGTGRP